jgi:hypothetical protein
LFIDFQCFAFLLFRRRKEKKILPLRLRGFAPLRLILFFILTPNTYPASAQR